MAYIRDPPYLLELIMEVMSEGIKDPTPECMLFADDIVLCGTDRKGVEQN